MSKKIIIGITVTICCLVSVLLATFAFAQTKSNTKQIYLRMTANKDSYILGEPIRLIGEYINNTNKDVLIHLGKTTVVAIAKEGEDYKWFDAAPTDCSISNGFSLKANQTYTTPYKPFTPRNGLFLLNAIGPEPHSYTVRTERVEPVYAFQEVGVYYAKYGAELIIDKKTTKTESIITEPVKITITEPTGNDLEVWKIIGGEDRQMFADLMRSGSYNDNIKDEAKKTASINQVEQILIDYPNSTYSTYLRDGLDNFKRFEAEKLKVKN